MPPRKRPARPTVYRDPPTDPVGEDAATPRGKRNCTLALRQKIPNSNASSQAGSVDGNEKGPTHVRNKVASVAGQGVTPRQLKRVRQSKEDEDEGEKKRTAKKQKKTATKVKTLAEIKIENSLKPKKEFKVPSEDEDSVSSSSSSVRQLSLAEQVTAYFHGTQPSLDFPLPPSSTPDEVALEITNRSLWSPDLLGMFLNTTVATLQLPPYKDVSRDHFPLLRIFFEQKSFANLTKLTLSHIPLGLDEVDQLRVLPCLRELNLSATGINNSALYSIVCLRHTLQQLDVTYNPGINDDAVGPIAALSNLIELSLHGTEISMPGLRRLIGSVSPEKLRQYRLLSIPSGCKTALNIPKAEIPESFIKEPNRVELLHVEDLKRFLKKQQMVDENTSLKGTKVELMRRLKGIFESRACDDKIRDATKPKEGQKEGEGKGKGTRGE